LVDLSGCILCTPSQAAADVVVFVASCCHAVPGH
jgi:hypothetical protein